MTDIITKNKDCMKNFLLSLNQSYESSLEIFLSTQINIITKNKNQKDFTVIEWYTPADSKPRIKRSYQSFNLLLFLNISKMSFKLNFVNIMIQTPMEQVTNIIINQCGVISILLCQQILVIRAIIDIPKPKFIRDFSKE